MEPKFVVDVLKETLKSRKMSYSQLAKKSGVPESTLKKNLANEDIPLSRLHSLCDALGLTLTEFFEIVKMKGDKKVNYFTVKQEQAFAKDMSLYILFNKIHRQGWLYQDLTHRYEVKDLHDKLFALEKLDLLKFDKDRPAVLLKFRGPLRFRPESRLHQMLLERGANTFLRHITEKDLEDTDVRILSFSLLHENTSKLLGEKVVDLYKEIVAHSVRDRYAYPKNQLHEHTLLIGFGRHETLEELAGTGLPIGT